MKGKKWSKEEDAVLMHHVEIFPNKLGRCFVIVAEITGRTPKAVSSHWYSSLSKRNRLSEPAKPVSIISRILKFLKLKK